MKTINDVQKFLETIPDIYCGGCGIASYALYIWLIKNDLLNDSFRFVYYYSDEYKDVYKSNSKALSDKKCEPQAANHVCIMLDGIFYLDVPSKTYHYIQFVDNVDFVLKSINNIKSWNSDFDRRWIGYIEERLDIDLSDIVSVKILLKKKKSKIKQRFFDLINF